MPATSTAASASASSAFDLRTGLLGDLAAAGLTPAQAVARAESEAAANGISTHISVTSRTTGTVLAQTSNAGTQVASESVVKLMIASYYLVLVGGYQHQSASVLGQLSYMIRYSDDATASAYFTSAAVPTIAARYGMGSTINATDRVGHWGAVRITAKDMTTFLYRAAHDPQVGPWLLPVMAQVAPNGSDGFNQAFGLNALSGTHGSKQGWGDDQFWSPANEVINSVGYTDKYYVAILQNSYSYPDPARATATYAAKTIQASVVGATATPPAPPKNGEFVRSSLAIGNYRIAGGAPILVTSWSGFGGPKPITTITAAQWRALETVPIDGTFLRSTTGQLYRVAGGAPLYVSSAKLFSGSNQAVTVDAQAIAQAGQTVALSHLKTYPVDGSFLRTTAGIDFKVVSGTPTYIGGWARFGGTKPTTTIDASAVEHAGQGGVYAHLRDTIPDNTFITDNGNNNVYRMAGGAPIYVSSWSVFGGKRATQFVDSAAIAHAGGTGPYAHIRSVPINSTFVRAGTGTVYRMAGGAPLAVTDTKALSTTATIIQIDPAAVTRSGQSGVWTHLLTYPSTGTFLEGVPSGKAYQVRSDHVVQIGHGNAAAVRINQLTIDRAGEESPYNHLK